LAESGLFNGLQRIQIKNSFRLPGASAAARNWGGFMSPQSEHHSVDSAFQKADIQKSFPALPTGPLARRPERPLTRFIPRSLCALDPGATGAGATAQSCNVEMSRRQAAMPAAAESFLAPDWSPIQLYFQRYLRAFWLNASFMGALL
jgi:hypothetical protein